MGEVLGTIPTKGLFFVKFVLEKIDKVPKMEKIIRVQKFSFTGAESTCRYKGLFTPSDGYSGSRVSLGRVLLICNSDIHTKQEWERHC